jgi:hypothetical protein
MCNPALFRKSISYGLCDNACFKILKKNLIRKSQRTINEKSSAEYRTLTKNS